MCTDADILAALNAAQAEIARSDGRTAKYVRKRSGFGVEIPVEWRNLDNSEA
jgi:hypothetical protein